MTGLKGRVADLSDLLPSALTDNSGDRLWRILFVLGIAIGGISYGYTATLIFAAFMIIGTLLARPMINIFKR